MSEWQPIETAPKDGTSMLLHCNGATSIGYYRSEERYRHGKMVDKFEGWAWRSMFDRSDGEPTHWQPLPSPPEKRK